MTLMFIHERKSTNNTTEEKSYAGIYILSCSAMKCNIFLTVFHEFLSFFVPILEIYYYFEHNFSTFTKNNLETQNTSDVFSKLETS